MNPLARTAGDTGAFMNLPRSRNSGVLMISFLAIAFSIVGLNEQLWATCRYGGLAVALKKLLGAAGFWITEELFGGTRLDDLAAVHEYEMIGRLAREAHLGRDALHRPPLARTPLHPC